MIDATAVTPLVVSLADALRARGWCLATAESCTGGLIAAACTSLAGSSHWFERGFVTYSYAAKREQLGVDAALLAQHGAVSEAVACAMASGALERSPADFALAVTGIAGPGGGSVEKPVGLVHFCAARRDRPPISAVRTFGDIGRDAVRLAATHEALHLLMAQATLA